MFAQNKCFIPSAEDKAVFGKLIKFKIPGKSDFVYNYSQVLIVRTEILN